MNQQSIKTIRPIIFLFIILNGLIIALKTFLDEKGFDRTFLIYANLFLFFISITGFLIQQKAMRSPNTQVFVRGVYVSMMFKMFVTMIVVLTYVLVFRNQLNKPSLFTSMGIYAVYTTIEVMALTKLTRKKPNA